MLLHSDGRDFSVVYTYRQGLGPIGGSGANDVLFTSSDRMIFHWDGAFLTATPQPDELLWAKAIWSGGANDSWMAGTNGVMHWDSRSWMFTNVYFQDSRDLWGSSPSDLWTGGELELRHFDGRAWSRARPPSYDIQSGYSAGVRDSWILADGGALRHR